MEFQPYARIILHHYMAGINIVKALLQLPIGIKVTEYIACITPRNCIFEMPLTSVFLN